MIKKLNKKLGLNKVSIASLDANEMNGIKGGSAYADSLCVTECGNCGGGGGNHTKIPEWCPGTTQLICPI